jgi:exopolysaccharide biosynthesis polyprenyl glycosylphosphotransferase
MPGEGVKGMALGESDVIVDRLAAVDQIGNGAAGIAYERNGDAATIDVLDTRTIELLKLRRAFRPATRRRGWLVRRALVVADLVGLSVAFLIAQRLFPAAQDDHVHPVMEYLIFFATLPVWVIGARVAGLYDRDGERTDHSTADDLVGVFVVVTIGTWIVSMTAWLTHVVRPNPPRLVIFWALAIVLVFISRAIARMMARRSVIYLQNTVIVGAGDIGQLVARKILKHPEYGLNLVGFVDVRPKERREDLDHLTLLGGPDQLPSLVELLDVDRVIFAFSNEPHQESVDAIRALRALNVQIDVVPRLFEIVGPHVEVHTVEGLPLVGLPPTTPSAAALAVKRTTDIVVASIALLISAPFWIYIAWRIKRESPGPIFFRQTRLGRNMREFTALKFRTMRDDTDEDDHREYVKSMMSASTPARASGLYKLDREDCVTPFGKWLRRTSLDELPQFVNILRGDMSLVGPRPCIPYETENFETHHFERFLMPAGLTGLWQVTARARATFGEALEMDVAYARGWSLGLDMRLLFRTPIAVVRDVAAGTR